MAVAVTVVMVLALGGWLVDRVVPAGAGPGGAPSSAPEPVPMPVPVPVPVAPGPVPGGRHLVQPGDTYWSLAVALDQPGDVRARVDALQRANGGRPLHVGDLVVLPQ